MATRAPRPIHRTPWCSGAGATTVITSINGHEPFNSSEPLSQSPHWDKPADGEMWVPGRPIVCRRLLERLVH